MFTHQVKKPSMTLFLLGLVMVVNALSYGMIIPLLYPYASRFGVTPLGMSALFASFSLAQFLATPILGRLSDRYGRKPLMTVCLFGTALSLALFGAAQSVVMLFIARTLDGITGGNNSIAQAMIADSASGAERAKAFGILGAAFGFGFLFGPAVGGVLGQISMTLPFYFASGVAVLSGVLCLLFLPETLQPNTQSIQKHEPLFRPMALVQALFSPAVGIVLFITLLTAIGMNAMILGFQTYTVDVLRLSPFQIGLFFSSFGLVSIIMQMGAIGVVLRRVPSKKVVLFWSLAASAMALFAAFLSPTTLLFFVAMMGYAVFGAFRDPLLSALVSERTRSEDQGMMMGVSQSYISLGQIVGPLLAGAIAIFSTRSVFLAASGILTLSAISTLRLFVKTKPVDV